MKLRGRITIYGEAFGLLLDYATLSVPTRQSLCLRSDGKVIHSMAGYKHELDEARKYIMEHSTVNPSSNSIVSGDLPIGYGLASSTVLGLLHLNPSDFKTAYTNIMSIDESVNGFAPSGADFWAVKTQQAGLFGRGTWTPVHYTLPEGAHLLIPEREGKQSKLAATRALQSMSEKLVPLINRMSKMVLRGGAPDAELLSRYCWTLLSGDVYSSGQRDVICSLLERQILAKGTGSMYDRAIVVFASESVWEGKPPMPVVSQ